jgi:hypothetical protein
MTVLYEWDHETTDKHGDIRDHNFADTLKGSCFDPQVFHTTGNDLVLVRDDVACDGNVEDRVWAYCTVVGGVLVLAGCWNNGVGDMPNWKVPKKFHNELDVWQRRQK